jgi:hypothetical protein
MMKIYRKIIDKVYSTFLGGFYLEFLLWLDGTRDEKKFLTPKQMAQIVRESSKLAEGTLAIKLKVNSLLSSRTKGEYEVRLSEIQDLLPLSEYQDKNSTRAVYVNFLKSLGDTTKIVDVENATDRAIMIDRKIKAVYELQAYTEKRNMAKAIKKAISDGNVQLANQLKEELQRLYGR